MNSSECVGNGEIFDIVGHFAKSDADSSELPKTPIVSKPSESAIELALKIANINPRRTVSSPEQNLIQIYFWTLPHSCFAALL